MYDCLIAGRVVTPSGIVEQGWLAISGESIAAIGSGTRPEARVTSDYGDAYIMPGVIDGQTHAGSQTGFPGMAPTSHAAVMGGVTTFVDMPYDEPEPVTTGAILRQKVEAVHEFSVCDVALYGTIPSSPDLQHIAELVDGGVCAFKISSFEAHPTRFPRIDNGATLLLMQALAGSGLPLGLHNEDHDVVARTSKAFRDAGKTGAVFHDPSRPEVAELAATATFLELGRNAGAHLHIVHISTPRGFELVRRYREAGLEATAEMCVHYLHFDAESDMPRLGGLLKVNPPIRTGYVEELWEVLAEGGAEFISSDHSAWPLSRKNNASIFDAAAGMPGLETLLPVFFTDASQRLGGDAAALLAAKLMGENPARFFGLARKGRLEAGLDADLVVLAPQAAVYDPAKNPEGPGWSAYQGETFAATPAATYVRGRLAWDGSAVTAEPGSGRFIPRKRA